MEFKHVSIMLNECIQGLNIKPDGVYVDATLGGAGHSSEIAKHLSKNGTLIGIDKDLDAIKVATERLSKFECNKIIVHSDFKNLKQILQENNISNVDGILADLGVSSYQIDEVERGFSYSKDAKLDMRMNKTQSLTAYDVVNTYEEKDLVKILFDYGEENYARSIVKNIVKERQISPINSTFKLVEIIEKSVPAKILHKGGSVANAIRKVVSIKSRLDNVHVKVKFESYDE